jgi:hypothetical protein
LYYRTAGRNPEQDVFHPGNKAANQSNNTSNNNSNLKWRPTFARERTTSGDASHQNITPPVKLANGSSAHGSGGGISVIASGGSSHNSNATAGAHEERYDIISEHNLQDALLMPINSNDQCKCACYCTLM